MIEIINDIPGNVAGFIAKGKVNKTDYENVVIPAIDALVQRQGNINFLLVLDTDLTDFTAGAILEDISVGLKHFTKWRKMAIVSGSAAINKFTDLFSYIAPGEAKGFTHEQLQEATAWVSS